MMGTGRVRAGKERGMKSETKRKEESVSFEDEVEVRAGREDEPFLNCNLLRTPPFWSEDASASALSPAVASEGKRKEKEVSLASTREFG